MIGVLFTIPLFTCNKVNRRALDGLHMDINSKESFKKIAVRAIATVPLNSEYVPDEMVNYAKVPKLDKLEAETKWRQNDLMVTNYLPSAAKQVQNPGWYMISS